MLLVHVGSNRPFQRLPSIYGTEKIRKTILNLMLIKYHAHYIFLLTTRQATNQC